MESNLTQLDLSMLPDLEILACFIGQLTSVDVTKNRKLNTLQVRQNNLTSLDVSNNPELVNLYCNDNQLTVLDVSNNTKLELLNCSMNQLATLDLSKNTVINRIECYQNSINGEGMQALVNSLPTVAEGGLIVYNEEASDGNQMTKDQVAQAKAKGWSPRYYGLYWDWKSMKEYQGVASGIKDVRSDADRSGRWYMLNGQQLQGEPTQKGIFINNGKKVVIK